MKASSRVLALLAGAAVVSMAIAIGITVRTSPDTDVSRAGDNGRELGSPAVASTTNAPAIASPESANQSVETDVNASAASVPADPLTPKDVRTRVREARRLLELGRAGAAESLLVPVVTAVPQSASAWNVMGRVQLALGSETEAQAAFQRACDLDSTQAWARNNLGWLHLQNDDWSAALPLLEAATRLRDDVAVFHNNLGAAYERARRFEDAAREYARAIELHPEHTTAGAALVRVRGRLDSAIAAVQPADSVATTPATER